MAKQKKTSPTTAPLRIVVLQRGLVVSANNIRSQVGLTRRMVGEVVIIESKGS